MCGYVVARVPFSECPVFPGASTFFTRRGSNFLRMWIIHREKGTLGGPARDLRGD